jgi:hypothetical protein
MPQTEVITMLPTPLSRVAAPLALLAGVIFVGAQVVLLMTFDLTDRPATLANPVFVTAQIAYFIGFCVLLVALVATYEREAHRAGTFGLIAFLTAAVGTMFLAGDQWFDTFAGPWIIEIAPEAAGTPSGFLVTGALASYALFAIGWVMFGLASARARVFPLAISLGIVLGGALGFFALMPPFGIGIGLAMLALGAWLVRTPQPGAAARPDAAAVGTLDATPARGS